MATSGGHLTFYNLQCMDGTATETAHKTNPATYDVHSTNQKEKINKIKIEYSLVFE